METGIYDTTTTALIEARSRERLDPPVERYVVKVPEGYVIVDKMPFLGEWWSSDGVKHG